MSNLTTNSHSIPLELKPLLRKYSYSLIPTDDLYLEYLICGYEVLELHLASIEWGMGTCKDRWPMILLDYRDELVNAHS